MKSPADTVVEALSNLKRGDVVTVYYQDPCDFQGFPIPEEAVEQAKLSDTGEFEKIVESGGVHILILVTGSMRTQGHIIPVGSIYEVDVLKKKGRVKKRKRMVVEQPTVHHITHHRTVIVKKNE